MSSTVSTGVPGMTTVPASTDFAVTMPSSGRNNARVAEEGLRGILLRAGLLLASQDLLLFGFQGAFVGQRRLVARLRSIEFLAAQ